MKRFHQAKWSTCDQSLAATQVRQWSTNYMERGEKPSLRRSHNKGNKRQVPQPRNRKNPSRNPFITVEQSYPIQEVNVQQRKPHATNVTKKDTTAAYADQRARMSKPMRYKSSQQQPVVQQDYSWHSTIPARLPPLHPTRRQVQVLASHTEQNQQPNDNSKHPTGQIKVAMTNTWTKNSRRFLQERFGRILRGIPNIHNTADDVLVDRKSESPHEKSIITLLDIARAKYIT